MKKSLNSFQLKCITVAFMIVGIYLQQIIFLLNKELISDGGTLSKSQTLLYNAGYVLYLAAFPLSAFLLVEAFLHTADRKKLLLRLLVTALLVELPMDMAYNNARLIAKPESAWLHA